jgi:hypothetical protein
MTTKEQVLELVQKLEDNASIDRVIYELELLKNVRIGLEQIERGEFFEHDEVFEELLKDDEEDQDYLVQAVKGKPQRNKKIHQPKRSKNRQGVRELHKGRGKKA